VRRKALNRQIVIQKTAEIDILEMKLQKKFYHAHSKTQISEKELCFAEVALNLRESTANLHNTFWLHTLLKLQFLSVVIVILDLYTINFLFTY